MDEEQLDRFGEAVEQKKRASKKASEAPHDNSPRGSAIDGDQSNLTDPSTTQDTGDPREKSSAKDKVTADKWNQ